MFTLNNRTNGQWSSGETRTADKLIKIQDLKNPRKFR